jgi:hypothetical protein
VTKYGWICLILGGLLELPLNVGVDVEALASWQLTALSLASALGLFLVAVGFDALADHSGGGAPRSFLQVGGIGLLILGGVEVASVVLPLANASHTGENLPAVFTFAAGLVIVAGLGAGISLIRPWPVVAAPLLAGAAALVVTIIPNAQWMPGYAMWAISCMGLGLALKASR